MKIIYIVYLACAFLGALATPQIEVKNSDIELVFFSVKNPANGVITDITNAQSVARTAFSKGKDTVFCIHGWLDKVSSGSCLPIKDSLLRKYDINVFLVDWDKIATNWLYPMAFAQIEPLGKKLASLLNNFKDTSGLNFGKTSIVGHSLGAHLAGVAGAALYGQIDHIVGLDPAGPLFTSWNTQNRLTPSSAKFVQVIHTCGYILGYFDPIGHADYYPNGGMKQHMCGVVEDVAGVCSHKKAIEFYAESLLTGNFKGKKCDNYDDYQTGKCNGGAASKMGEYNVDKGARGTYYLQTNDHPPYARN